MVSPGYAEVSYAIVSPLRFVIGVSDCWRYQTDASGVKDSNGGPGWYVAAQKPQVEQFEKEY